MPVSLLYPHRRHLPRRVRALTSWLADTLRPHLQEQVVPPHGVSVCLKPVKIVLFRYRMLHAGTLHATRQQTHRLRHRRHDGARAMPLQADGVLSAQELAARAHLECRR